MKKNLYILLSTVVVLFFSLSSYAQPVFTGGHVQTLSVCQNSSTMAINSYLTVSDANTGTTDTWIVVLPPTHGSISASYSTTSIGGTLTPTGTTYGPSFGYTGSDSFTVRVTDGLNADTTTVYITVNPSPTAITGTTTLCSGTTSTLSNGVGGGTWTSSNGTVATIGSSSGIVTAGIPGTSTVTYALAGGCSVITTVNVIASPAAISGAGTVCSAHIIALSDASGGGTWSSSNTTIATISTGGLVTGITGGTVTMTYKVGSGCLATKAVTINPTAIITGATDVCPLGSTILSASVPGGTWNSGNPSVATISSGTVTGVVAGTASISYTTPSGCISFQAETVDPNPAPISGSLLACIGGTSSLSDATPGGSWSNDDPSVATIGLGTGIVTGIAAGTTNVTFTLLTTGCMTSSVVTVNTLPTPYLVSGGGTFCSGGAGVHIFMNNSDVATSYYLHNGTSTFGPFFGTGSPMDLGLFTLAGTYTATANNTTTTCTNIMAGSASVSVITSVVPTVSISSDHGDTVCGGTTTIFSVTPVNGGTTPMYQWSVNGTPVGIDTTAYVFVPNNGDVVTAYMVTNVPCPTADTVYDTLTMVVVDRDTPIVSLSPFPSDTICLGSTITLTPVPVFGGHSPTYFYTKNGVVIGAGATVVDKPEEGDVYKVYMMSDFFCRLADTVEGTIGVVIDTPRPPYFQVLAYPPVLTGPGQTVTLTAIVTNSTGPFSYQWFVNDSAIAGATSDTFISNNFVYMGNDSVTCVVTHYGACYLTTFNWRKMLNNVGVQQVAASLDNVSVLPNPSKGSFEVKGAFASASDEEATIEISNMLGQVVFKSNFTARGGIINERVSFGNSLANGMYLLNVRSATANKVFHIVIEQ